MLTLYTIILIYFLCSVFYILHLWIQKKILINIGITLGVIAFTLHSFFYVMNLIEGNQIVGGLSKSLFFFSWLIVIVYLVSRIKFSIPILGTFIFPLAFIGSVPSLIIPEGIVQQDPTLNNPWILTHIILIFLGEAFFAIAFISGLLYLFEEGRIKKKQINNSLRKLPSLTALDKIAHFSLMLGFPLVTLGLAIGLFLANQIWGPQWTWGTKETWSLVTWVFYAILINGRVTSDWKGRKSAVVSIIGFFIILFTLIIGYMIPGQHTFK